PSSPLTNAFSRALISFFPDFAQWGIEGPVVVDVDRHIRCVGLTGFVQNDLAAARPALELFIGAQSSGDGRFARPESDRQRSESAGRRISTFDFSRTTGHARFGWSPGFRI